MALEFVVAFDKHYAIGREHENRMPWHIPSDLRLFKERTLGRRVVMGRKTWESLPDSVRPLPGRENFVLSRRRDYRAPGAQMIHTIDEVLEMGGDKPVIVIGGGEMFHSFLPYAIKVYCTLVQTILSVNGGGTNLKFPFDEIRSNPAWHEDEQAHEQARLRDKNDEHATAYQCWLRTTPA